MRVMRINKDSVMAMLEAFAFDPLISWRLLVPQKASGAEAEHGDEVPKEGSSVRLSRNDDNSFGGDEAVSRTLKSMLNATGPSTVEVSMSVKDAAKRRTAQFSASDGMDNAEDDINSR